MSLPSRQDNWIADLAFETALGYFSPEELLLKYAITADHLASVESSTPFQKAVALYRREIDETGAEFKLKARKLASELLPEAAAIVADPSQSTADRLSAFKEIARLAGYGKEDATQSGGGFALQINFTGAAPPAVVVPSE